MAKSLSLSELANLIDGNIVCGHESDQFSGMAALDTATRNDISFLGNEKYYPQFLTTAAGVVIVPDGHPANPAGPALVAVKNPSLAFASVVKHFAQTARSFKPGIHPAAVVADFVKLNPNRVCIHAGAVIMDGASIGDGSEIGPNSVIHEHAVIGQNCQIRANVTIAEGCILGDHVIVHPGTVIGSDGYGYEFSNGQHIKIDQVGIVEIGNHVEIGSNTTIDRARFGKTIIGEGTKIDNLVQIGHNVSIGKHCLIVSQSGIAGSARIEDYVTIAAQSGIVGHVTVGAKSILAARTGVTTSLPGGMVYSGKPAIPMKEDTKLQALVRRLPKLVDRVKALEKTLQKD
ncbi:MAG: UDP-3-O-(3-hydroxymyristoyl)glucosamine N-acyltransferase [Verrucomicrobiota bacterium]